MIKAIITQTSSDYWYDIKTISNLEALMKIYRQKGKLILRKNFWHRKEPTIIQNCWENISLEEAKEISECELNLEIYDSYRE